MSNRVHPTILLNFMKSCHLSSIRQDLLLVPALHASKSRHSLVVYIVTPLPESRRACWSMSVKVLRDVRCQS